MLRAGETAEIGSLSVDASLVIDIGGSLTIGTNIVMKGQLYLRTAATLLVLGSWSSGRGASIDMTAANFTAPATVISLIVRSHVLKLHFVWILCVDHRAIASHCYHSTL